MHSTSFLASLKTFIFKNSRRLSVIRLIAIGIPFGLLGVGFSALLLPEFTAKSFGILAPTGESRAYLFAAGTRDIFIGLVLQKALLDFPRKDAAKLLGLLALLPLSDGLSVLYYKGFQPEYLTLHFGSMLAIICVSVLLYQEA